MERAKLIKTGRSQAIRLPKGYEFPGTQVYLKRVGEGVLVLPEDESWDSFFAALVMFTDDFMEIRNQPPAQNRGELSV
jgi:antitoxin VapB